MPLHESSIPPLHCLVRREFLTDNPEHEGQYEKAVAVSVRSVPGSCALFQVLLENGALRDKLPIHALHDTEHKHIHPFHHLQLWNCFSANFSIVEIYYLSGLRVDVKLKSGDWASGTYLWTLQWGPDYTHGADLSLAIHPSEHKSGHFILLDCGEFAIQPNNRLRWHEPSHVTKPFPEKPDYVVNVHEWNCEAHAKWQTEDSDAWFYEAREEAKPQRWRLPDPPEGKRWHRDDWTEEMLPPGYRPLLDGEERDPVDLMWASFEGPWIYVAHADFDSQTGPVNRFNTHFRTTRPLPTTP